MPDILKYTGNKTYDGRYANVWRNIPYPPTDICANLAKYDKTTKTFSTSGQDSSLIDVQFNADGTKLYTLGAQNDSVYQYSLSNPYDITSAVYDNVVFSLANEDYFQNAIQFSVDGTKLYTISNGLYKLVEYTLSTPWDLSTASYSTYVDMSTHQAPYGLTLSQDGKYVYIANRVQAFRAELFRYTLSTPYSLSTISSSNTGYFYFGDIDFTIQGIAICRDGGKLYAIDSIGPIIATLALNTAYDLATAQRTAYDFNLTEAGVLEPYGIFMPDNLLNFYIAENDNDNTISQFPYVP